MFRRKPVPGLVENPFDPRDAWLDEVLAGDPAPLPVRYRTEGLQFEPQGAWPFCAAFAVTKMVEYAVRQKTRQNHDLSQPHLFFHAGGTRSGSTFRGNLEVARTKGCIRHSRLPMPDDLYDLSPFERLRDAALAEPFAGARTILGYARVQTDRETLQRAVRDHGMVLVGVKASGGYWGDRAKRPKGADDHAVLLVGWEDDGAWVVFDSLQPKSDFSGYHVLSRDYGFNSAYVVTELPEDWKEKRDEAREAPPNNANYYGKVRNLELEQRVAVRMLDEFKRLGNQSVLEAAGRFWETYIRAVAYGGYSVSYTKWGMWQPGDILNDCYMWRRTGQHIFDFDKLRSEYK